MHTTPGSAIAEGKPYPTKGNAPAGNRGAGTTAHRHNSTRTDAAELERAADALDYVSPEDRATWVRMGQALRDKFGDAAFSIFDAWSQGGSTYDAATIGQQWNSFKPGKGITIASLYHEAMANGWRPDTNRPPPPKPTPAELDARAEQQREADEARSKVQERVATESAAEWETLKDALEDHPYLVRKGIKPHGAGIDARGNLVIALKYDGKICNLQRILPETKPGQPGKLFEKGGRVNGCRVGIGGKKEGDNRVILCEGWATAASVHEATGLPAVACLSASNIKNVAPDISARYPEMQIIIAADIEDSGAGLRAAYAAARPTRALVAVPDFGPDGPSKDRKDFNDLARLRGPEAVRACIGAAAPPPMSEPQPTPENVTAGDSGLPVPQPLPKLPPVPDFPLDLLPDNLAPWIGDASDRARFRPDLAAVAGMAALGSTIGRKLGIRLKRRDDWTEYANIWAAMVAPPAGLKSPAMREALKPFKALQVAADERYAQEKATYDAAIAVHELRKAARKKVTAKTLADNPEAPITITNDEPTAPVARTYWTTDANDASLSMRLAENPNGLMIERDELSSLLVSLEDERNATLRGMLLSGWSGSEGYRCDRVGRGVTVLPKFALSVVGGIQPGPLARYVRGAFSGERADGLLQRFQLISWPDPEPFEYVDRLPAASAREAAATLFKSANEFNPKDIGEEASFGDAPPFVRLSDAAQEIFTDWYTRFMRERRGEESGSNENGPIAAHFGKYPGLVGKLALILHVADDPKSRQVSERTMLKALGWIEYLTPHARRVYHAVEHPETGAAELLLHRLRAKELPISFKAWEITKKGWHGLTDRDGVKKACRLLFEYGWLIEIESGGGQGVGRPADPVYAVSPAAGVAP